MKIREGLDRIRTIRLKRWAAPVFRTAAEELAGITGADIVEVELAAFDDEEIGVFSLQDYESDAGEEGVSFRLRRASFAGEGLSPDLADGTWEDIRDEAYRGRGS